MNRKTYRCFIFSHEQEEFLRNKKYKIDRMSCFMSLIDKVVCIPTLVNISNHRQMQLEQGQFVVNDIELSHLWKLDRKTVGKLMKQMETLGMFTSTKVAEVSVYSMHVLGGWIIDGFMNVNQFYRKPPKPDELPKWKIPEVNQIVVKSLDSDESKVIYPVDVASIVMQSSPPTDSGDCLPTDLVPSEQSSAPIGCSESSTSKMEDSNGNPSV